MNSLVISAMIIALSSGIQENVVKLNPVLDRFYVQYLSNSIETHSKENKIDPNLLTIILFQESSFVPNPRKCDQRKCRYDIGIGQINYRVWKNYFNLDYDKLANDIDYNIEIAAKILADYKRRYAKRDPHWFARYHSGTPHLKQKYLRKLKRHMETLK